MSPFSIELDSFVSLILYLLLTFVAYVFCLLFVWVVFVNTWPKGGRNRWNVWILFKKVFKKFCLGELKLFMKGGEYNFFFNVSKLRGRVSLLLFLYCVSYYCLYIFLSTHSVMCSFECFQERQVHSNQDLLHLFVTSRLGVLDWDLWCIWAFYCIWELCYVVCVFCHGLPKGEIVRFWVCNVGKPWQNMRKTKSHWFRMVYIKVEHKKTQVRDGKNELQAVWFDWYLINRKSHISKNQQT